MRVAAPRWVVQEQNSVSALFDERGKADAAIEGLLDASFDPEQIDVLLHRERTSRRVGVNLRVRTAAFVITGAVAGAVLGALAGTLINDGIIAFPMTKTLLTTSPLLAVFQGAFFGMGVGGLIGVLGGLGWWRTRVELPVDEQSTTTIEVCVRSRGDRQEHAARLLAVAGGFPSRSPMYGPGSRLDI